MSYVHETEGHMIIGTETDGRDVHMRRLNRTLCEIWQLTPHGKGGAELPNCANGDVVLGTDIDARMFYYVDPATEKTSHQYWIIDDGRIVCDTDELMDLKSATHLFGIIHTIIKDIYGDYEAEPVMNTWFQQMGIQN